MARKKRKQAGDNRKKVLGIVLFLLSVFLLVSLSTHRHVDDLRITGQMDSLLSPFETNYSNQGGMAGAYLSYLTFGLLGWLAFFLPLGLILVSLKLFQSTLGDKLKFNSFLLFVISLLGTMIFNIHLLVERGLGTGGKPAGGYVSEKLTLLCTRLVGELGSYIVLSGVIIILLMLYTSITPLLSAHLSLPGSEMFKKGYGGTKWLVGRLFSFRWFPSKSGEETSFQDSMKEALAEESYKAPETGEYIVGEDESASAESTESAADEKLSAKRAALAKVGEQLQLKTIDYRYPSVDLLTENLNNDASVNKEELTLTARMLKETLETFGVRIDGDIAYFPGPIITRFEFKPGTGIKVNQIINLADDLALALKAKRIRIIAPIPGKAAVGVEIPNRTSQMVFLRDILDTNEFKDIRHRLPLAMGKTTSGKPFVADLARMPHVLIAGATGSGKSVCMNAIITSLLYRLHPWQLRFIFIDPKMLELSVYSGIPHLGRPVVTKPNQAERVLSDAVVEMEARYRKLANASVRHIVDYNQKQKEVENKLPYIVICVDELADLMMSATSSKIEMLITRLAQMSRAVGIHLILATQRPSVDVITGLIKANFPSRVAFQVSSKVDSRTIIDANGAEKLIGNGDMLFLETGQPEPVRIHGAYVSSEETDKVVNFIREQGLEMMALENISQSTGELAENDVDFGDPLFREACEVVIRHKQGSVSLLQRRLGIGYQRAARLIDKLEQAGVVSPFDGSKAREVLVDKSYLESTFPAAGQASPANQEKN